MQAPIGGAAGHDLYRAVAGAGGLATIPASWMAPDDLRREIADLRCVTDQPFAVNLVLHFEQAERVALCIAERVPVVTFSWGQPGGFVGQLHAAGCRVFVQVGDVEAGREAVAAGADALIAQGIEAGGHVWSSSPLAALVAALSQRNRPAGDRRGRHRRCGDGRGGAGRGRGRRRRGHAVRRQRRVAGARRLEGRPGRRLGRRHGDDGRVRHRLARGAASRVAQLDVSRVGGGGLAAVRARGRGRARSSARTWASRCRATRSSRRARASRRPTTSPSASTPARVSSGSRRCSRPPRSSAAWPSVTPEAARARKERAVRRRRVQHDVRVCAFCHWGQTPIGAFLGSDPAHRTVTEGARIARSAWFVPVRVRTMRFWSEPLLSD